jgi:hypothetical protein
MTEREPYDDVRRVLGGLPPVEPPAGFFESMLERGSPRPHAKAVPFGRRLGTVAAGALATAAAWVVVAGAEPDVVHPPFDDAEVAAVAGRDPFALHRQEGEVDWSELPRGLRRREEGAETWVDLTADPGVARVVIERDGVVYTMVSERLDADALVDIGIDLPGDGSGVVDRLRRAGRSLLDALSLE